MVFTTKEGISPLSIQYLLNRHRKIANSLAEILIGNFDGDDLFEAIYREPNFFPVIAAGVTTVMFFNSAQLVTIRTIFPLPGEVFLFKVPPL